MWLVSHKVDKYPEAVINYLRLLMLAEAADLLRRKSVNLASVSMSSSALSCVRLSNASSLFYHFSGHGTFLKHNRALFGGIISLPP